MSSPWGQTNSQRLGREVLWGKPVYQNHIREIRSTSHQGDKKYRQRVETWSIHVTWSRIFTPDAVTSEDQGPPAVVRVGVGEGQGEGTALAWRHGVREAGLGWSRTWVWLKWPGRACTKSRPPPFPSFPMPQSAICVGLADRNPSILSDLKEGIPFLENSLEMDVVFTQVGENMHSCPTPQEEPLNIGSSQKGPPLRVRMLISWITAVLEGEKIQHWNQVWQHLNEMVYLFRNSTAREFFAPGRASWFPVPGFSRGNKGVSCDPIYGTHIPSADFTPASYSVKGCTQHCQSNYLGEHVS